MTVTCPAGHASATADYCDQCGAPIAALRAQPTAVAAAPAILDEELDTSAAAPRLPCPVCGAPRSGDDRYCEGCGHDFSSPPAAAAAWEALATADRSQFERQPTAGLSFPADYATRRFVLEQPEVRIGRSRTGEAGPEIDLAQAPTDPGISRLHAVLERQQDGSYTLRDLGSTNGTVLNDGSAEVGEEAGVPLGDGDRIHLGAWTTITLRRR
jgi:hypothetical protein